MSELALRLIEENKRTKNPFLDLGNCGLEYELPSELGDCVWLEELNLGYGYYNNQRKWTSSSNTEKQNKFIGKELNILKNLNQLKTLNIIENDIVDISFLKNIRQLNSLDISLNPIKNYTVLSLLKDLRVLSLVGNMLKDISFLQNLTQLHLLGLRGNKQITDYKFLQSLIHLQTLDLGNHQIQDINFLQNLTKLQSLVLSGTRIQDFSFLQNLKQLKTLDLRNNQIQDISFLQNLKKLQSLDLSSNQIEDISLLQNLKKLQSLDLSSNQIVDISLLQNLTELQSLLLRGTRIQDFSFLQNLKQLKTLDLRNNQIQDISFLHNLKKLQSLDLSSNQIEDISLLQNLTQLQSLNFSENLVEDISFLSDLLKRGISIEVDSDFFRENTINLNANPIRNPPLEIVKQGNKAILRYFEQIGKEGEEYIYEAKLTLVGDGGAGKTSLQKRILNKKASLPESKERTRGIGISDWSFESKENINYKVHIWDFGGQDVYYPVHRFFLTENSVFVLVGSTRTAVHNFDYWIPTIYQFGGESPIILVQNCFDGNRANWNELSVYFANNDFNLIKPFYPINLPENNKGLNPLEELIKQEIVKLPHIGRAVPKSWLKLKEDLNKRATSEHCISFERFTEICTTLDKDNLSEAKDIEIVGKFLHALGIILWFHDKPYLKEWVILQPEWAMKAVYKIIDDETIQNEKGTITIDDFNRLWHEAQYRNRHEVLKQMLSTFKIAFQKQNQKTEYVLPVHLPSLEAITNWDTSEKNIRLEYHFNFMPRGIVNQLSTDLSVNINNAQEDVWNDAVVFSIGKSKAQVVEDFFNRKMYIQSYGKDSRTLLVKIMDSTDTILQDYKGVKPLKFVPCYCDKCLTDTKPTLFSYEDLIEWSNERDTVTCNKSNSQLSIHQLLYNVGLDKETKNKVENNVPAPKPEIPEIYFSYAWGDDAETTEESRDKIVHNLYETLKADGKNVIIDKQDLGYKGLINEFMKRMGSGDTIVVAISDKYLKSPYCMYELNEIFKNSRADVNEFINKIIPIRVEDLGLGKPSVLDSYFDYWDNLEKEWEELVKKRGTRMGVAQMAEYDKIKRIGANLGDLLDILKNINSLTSALLSENNFQRIKEAIKQQMAIK